MTTSIMPQPTKKQALEIEASFIKSYGRSYNRMKKSELALMIANQSTNYKKIEEQANRISQLGVMYMKRWITLRNIVRFNQKKCSRNGKEYVKL